MIKEALRETDPNRTCFHAVGLTDAQRSREEEQGEPYGREGVSPWYDSRRKIGHVCR
jgi:hypothetical protein